MLDSYLRSKSEQTLLLQGELGPQGPGGPAGDKGERVRSSSGSYYYTVVMGSIPFSSFKCRVQKAVLVPEEDLELQEDL